MVESAALTAHYLPGGWKTYKDVGNGWYYVAPGETRTTWEPPPYFLQEKALEREDLAQGWRARKESGRYSFHNGEHQQEDPPLRQYQPFCPIQPVPGLGTQGRAAGLLTQNGGLKEGSDSSSEASDRDRLLPGAPVPTVPSRSRWTEEEVTRHSHLKTNSGFLDLLSRMPEDLNLDECPTGLKCEDDNCLNYHSKHERRCQAQGQCQDARCPYLHVSAADIQQELFVDFAAIEDTWEQLADLQQQSQNQRARFIRVFVKAFDIRQMEQLMDILQVLPMVHEILLVDMNIDPESETVVLLNFCDRMRQLAEKCPRLRFLKLGEKQAEELW